MLFLQGTRVMRLRRCISWRELTQKLGSREW